MSGMNLHDEMFFVLETVEPHRAKNVKREEAFPDASGCNMKSSYQVNDKDTKELAEMLQAQEDILGIPSGLKESQNENKFSNGKKGSKFLKESGSVHDEVISMCKILDSGEIKEVINSLMKMI